MSYFISDLILQAFRTRTVPVELILGVGVKAVAQDHLEYQPANSTEIKTLLTQTTIWTAGTAVNPLIQNLKSQIPADHLDKHGLPLVTSTLQLLDFPEVFAAGDCASVQPQTLPALAQVAYQQGASIAHNLIALAKRLNNESDRSSICVCHWIRVNNLLTAAKRKL